VGRILQDVCSRSIAYTNTRRSGPHVRFRPLSRLIWVPDNQPKARRLRARVPVLIGHNRDLLEPAAVADEEGSRRAPGEA
jgi:hypothetical protein